MPLHDIFFHGRGCLLPVIDFGKSRIGKMQKLVFNRGRCVKLLFFAIAQCYISITCMFVVGFAEKSKRQAKRREKEK